jgi:hypothetical protein
MGKGIILAKYVSIGALAMAVTRIKNNQITDSTITYTKIAPGTLVGSNFNENLTLNSNLSIVGNLTITGTSTTVSSTNTYVNDPLIVYNNGYAGNLSNYDIGMLVNRNLAALNGYGNVNTAWVWSEADNAFIAIATTDTGAGITSLNNSGFANVKLGNLTAASATLSGKITASELAGFHTGTGDLSTLVVTNFSSGNAQITGGNVQGIGYLQTANLSTANARINGGAINATPIGSTTPSVGIFTTATAAESITTGNASIGGNLSIDGNLFVVTGNITTANSAFFVGNTITGFNALYAGIPIGYTVLPQVVAQFSENYNGYAQINTQNINAGGDATTDYVATADNGSDSTYYVDLGINSSNYDPLSPTNSLGTATGPNDAYLYTQANGSANQGGNLVIGTTTDQRYIRFVVGGGNVSHVVATMSHPGTVSTSPSSGALVVTGGVGVTGNISAPDFYGNTVSQYSLVTNFATANAQITGGSVTGITGQASTFTATNFSTGNAQVSGGNVQGIGYLQATNFSTGNAVITGGSITGFTGAATTLVATNFSSGNAQITGGSVTGITGQASTFTTTNFSTGNAQITGGSVTGITGAATTFEVDNFSTGNAQITGGSVTGITGAATTFEVDNFSSGNAQITGGNVQGVQYLQTTNFSTGNAQITGGSVTGITGQASTFTATNFSSGNIVGILTGTASTGNVALYEQYTSTSTNATFYPSFTDNGTSSNSAAYTNTSLTFNPSTGTLSSTLVRVTGSDPATTSASGALVVTGGAGVGGNLYVGQNIVVSGNLTVQGTTTAINSATLDVTDLNITVAKGAGSAAAANGAGLTVDGANATLLYTNATDSWNFNKQVIGQFTTSNLQATGGSITNFTGAASTLVATNFSTGNAQITGGSVTGITGQASTFTSTNFSTGNAQITGGSVTGITGTATTFEVDNFSSGNIVGVLTGTASTGNVALYENYTATTNNSLFYPSFTDRSTSGNSAAYITPGINFNPGTNTINATTFSGTFSGTASITSGSVTGITGQASTFTATNFSSGNVVITGGTVHAISGNATTLNIGNLNATTAEIFGGNILGVEINSTTAFVGNLITPNVAVTGGQLTNLTRVGTTLISASNAQITGGSVTGLTNLNTTNFTASSATITSGSITGITGQADTFTVTNFSSGNAVITGGSIDSVTVGQNSPSHAHFTEVFANTIVSSSNVVINSSTPLINPTDAALTVPNGGAAFGGNTYVGGTLNVGEASLTTALVNSSIAAVNSVGDFAQMYMLNTSSTGSADFSAYGDNGTDTGGWVDMGMTGSAFNDPNYQITKPNDGYLIVRPQAGFGGNLVIATSEAGDYNNIVFATGGFSDSQEVARFVGDSSNGGFFELTQGTEASSTSTGALRVTGGAGITGNLYAGNVATTTLTTVGVVATGNISTTNALTVNTTNTAGMDFKVSGVNSNNLIWARANGAYDQVIIGNTISTGSLVAGAKLQINSKDSILLPIGTASERPSSSGATDVPGMIRFNTTNDGVEWYTSGHGWVTPTSEFTIISDNQFTGTGSQTNFLLSSPQTTNSCIVSVNGLVKRPVDEYYVTDNVLTFTSAPANAAKIDVRRLTTTQTVIAITDATGYNEVATDTDGVTIYSGTSSKVPTLKVDANGALVSGLGNVAVSTANVETAIDTFSKTVYRSAKYLIQASTGSAYQTMEALVIHDGTTPTVTTFGVVSTNGNLGVLTTGISGGTVSVNFVAANNSTNVRISKQYMLI